MSTLTSPTGHVLSPEEARARRNRNRAIGIVLVGLVALFYATTLAKLGFRIAGGP